MNGILKKFLSLLLCAITVFGCISLAPVEVEAAQDGIAVRITELRTKFPHKKFWNHYVTKSSEAGLSSKKDESFANSVTSHTCASHSANAKVGQYECNYFDGGIQCMGFALKVFYDIFGVRASTIKKRTDTQNIQVGDYVRMGEDPNSGHSAVVIARKGNTLTVVEANFHPGTTQAVIDATRCYIYWDRTFDISKVTSFRRAPNYDKIKGDVNYTLDVNVTLDGTVYASGHDAVTYDVYYGTTLKANDVKEYKASIPYGTKYTVNDIKVSGCYARQNTNAITGTITGNTTAAVPITVSHSPTEIPATPAGCLTTGLSKGEKCSVCSVILTKQTETPATGHSYKTSTVPATCTTLQQIKYTCKSCSHSYTATDPSLYTSWSASSAPKDAAAVETKTQYRYAEKEDSWQIKETGIIDYGVSWPSGFDKSSALYKQYNKTPLKASETATEKTVISTTDVGYIYWHWCRGDYTAGPINRKISDAKTSTYDTFHAFFSTKSIATDSSAGVKKSENKSVCTDSYWWQNTTVQVKRCTYTKYVKVNTDGYGEWSSWQDEKISADDSIKLETRTVYRYIPASSASYGEHKWSAWKNDSSKGIAARQCSGCGKKETKSILLTGDANFDGTVTAADARIALRISVGLDKCTDKHIEVADIDRDKKITASDARSILRASVGLETLKK